MGSRRCLQCNVQWPPSAATFDPCPECGGKTWQSSANPIGYKEALSRKRHADFERYLDEHDRRDPIELLERIATDDEQKAA